MKKYEVIVIGAGASGLVAAGKVAETGKKVLLIEKMKRPGRKLAITGKGRCNITTTVPLNDFIKQVHPDGRFLHSAFSQFYSHDLVQFLNKIGLPTIEERGNRIFPKSGKAFDVVDALVNWCKRNGVETITNTKVIEINTKDNAVSGVLIENSDNNRKVVESENIVLATGGLSYPLTGSTGDGYKLLKKLNHTINQTSPSLVPLEIDQKYTKFLKGLELKNVEATFWMNNKKIKSEFGELSFYEHGLTGPVILTLSRLIVPKFNTKEEIQIGIDLKPALSHEKLDKRLIRELDKSGKETLRTILNRLLPKLLIPICLRDLKLSANKLNHQINAKDRKIIVNWLKDFRLKVVGIRSYDEAIITAGGISTEEIDQKTMESKLVKGLYFTGEIIDVDGPTGGYNLQIAFSTGWLAGKSAAMG